MEVIGVRGVIFGGQERAENAAARVARISEKIGRRPLIAPVRTDFYPSAVREDECRYVDSVARGVLAPPRGFIPANPPAIVGSIVFQRDHAGTEVLLRCRLHAVAKPQRQSGIHGTGGGRSAWTQHKVTGRIGRKHRPVRASTGTLPNRRQSREADSATPEECLAFVGLIAKPSQLSSSRPSRWIADIQRRPRIMFGVVCEPAPSSQDQGHDRQDTDRPPVDVEVERQDMPASWEAQAHSITRDVPALSQY